MKKIVPLILAGGQGSRLWPASTPDLPKQFIPLATGGTTFENTLMRVADTHIFYPPVIICAARHHDKVADIAKDWNPHIICEPLGRNTAPAACVGAIIATQIYGDDSNILILPADHYIPDREEFQKAVLRAVDFSAMGKIVTFGIHPEFPHIEYGYIQKGNKIDDVTYSILSFTEKPHLEKAESYFASGEYVWNAGIFLTRADVLVQEIKTHQTDVLLYAQESCDKADKNNQSYFLDEAIFGKCPKISFDYAVMEKTDKACVAEVNFHWRDMGGWDALMEFTNKSS